MFTKDWPIGLFLKFYPDYKDLIPPFVIVDPEYIVRTQFDSSGTICNLEFGYKDDDWVLPEPKNDSKNLESN